jgi:hypothetical protein
VAETSDRAPVELTEDEFADICRELIDEALSWTDTNLRDPAATAWRRYHGEHDAVDAQPIDGGSELVISEIKDTALGMMPDLMELFAGTDRVVEFYDEAQPADGPQQQKMPPEAATEHANDVFWSCGGWRALHDTTLEAIVAGAGWWKVHRHTRRKVQHLPPRDMSLTELEAAQGSPDVTIMDAQEEIKDQLGMTAGYRGVRMRRYYEQSRIMLEAVPSHMMFVTDCVDPEYAHCVGEVREVRMGDLVAMGFDRGELEDVAGTDTDRGKDLRRQQTQQQKDPAKSHGHWSLKPTTLYELYPLIDMDGDGLPERYRVLMAGPERTLLRHELVEDHPYVLSAAWLVPHRLNGLGLGDIIADLQEARTKIVRAMLDNADDQTDPTLLAHPNGVDHNQLASRRRDKIVSERIPGSVRYLETPVIVAPLMAMNELLDQIRESRTGQSRIAQGLDPDALQNTTATAAMGTLGAAQRKQEMVARSLAEVGLKGAFKKLLKLIIAEGPVMRTPQGGPPQRVDPAGYDPSWGVRVVVGLGNMRRQELRQFYTMAFQAAQAVMGAMGPSNPLCNASHIAQMLQDWASQYPGVRPDKLFGSPDMVQQWMQQQAQQPPPPDPKMEEVKQKGMIEAQRLQLQGQTSQQNLALKGREIMGKERLREIELGAEIALDAVKAATPGQQRGEGNVRRPR